jgi:hypothetical protein
MQHFIAAQSMNRHFGVPCHSADSKVAGIVTLLRISDFRSQWPDSGWLIANLYVGKGSSPYCHCPKSYDW